MHALKAIKDACTEALRDHTPDANARFATVADPASVMEMTTMIESLLAYVETVDDLTAQELANDIRHKTSGAGPEGAV